MLEFLSKGLDLPGSDGLLQAVYPLVKTNSVKWYVLIPTLACWGTQREPLGLL